METIMPTKTIITAMTLGKSLYPDLTPLAEKQEILSQYFAPPPGESIVIDFEETHNPADKDPLKRRGFIKVNPPKESCFIIKKNLRKPDQWVCKPSVINFSFADLDTKGNLTWGITTGKDDINTEITWPTSYRRAQVVPAGLYGKVMGKEVPIIKCTIRSRQPRRDIQLDLVTGESWVIRLPLYDKLVPDQPPAAPNLVTYVISPPSDDDKKADQKKEAPKKTEQENSNETKKEEKDKKGAEEKKEGEDNLAELINKRITKEEVKKKYRWILPKRGTYQMPASHFLADDAPPGQKGICRYMFKGFSWDPYSLAVECTQIDKYDSIIVIASCGKDIGPLDETE